MLSKDSLGFRAVARRALLPHSRAALRQGACAARCENVQFLSRTTALLAETAASAAAAGGAAAASAAFAATAATEFVK